jgi:hypothetical protein
MDPQVSTSFIPKEALTAEKARTGGVGLFLLISILVFILSIIAAGGAFAYTGILNQKLAAQKSQLDLQKGAFDPATIQDLLRLDSRIQQSQSLLQKHVAPSAVFNFLAQNTLVNVQFTSFDYSLNADGSGTIELDGTADSFSTIALQSDALGQSSSLKDVIFSGITVDPDNRVSFTVSAAVDPSLLSYSKEQLATPAATTQSQ